MDITELMRDTFPVKADNQISASMFRQIRDYLCSELRSTWDTIEPAMMKVGSEWELTDKEKGLSGTFPKRLAKELHKHGLDMSDEVKARIGEMARRSMAKQDLRGRIVDNINWSAGEYGDAGSCFWAGRKEAKNIIKGNGGGAVILHDINIFGGMGDPIGRSLILPVGKASFVLFNTYGGTSIESVAAAMATHFDFTARPIELLDYGSWQPDDFWINGGSGYLLTKLKWNTKKIDLKLKRQRTCPECGETHWTSKTDFGMCKSCKAKATRKFGSDPSAGVCEVCQRVRSGLTYRSFGRNGTDIRHVCWQCLSSARWCDICGCYHL